MCILWYAHYSWAWRGRAMTTAGRVHARLTCARGHDAVLRTAGATAEAATAYALLLLNIPYRFALM